MKAFNGEWPDVQWFIMDRREDESGISGTGAVAYVLALRTGVFVFWDTGWHTFEWLPNLDTWNEIHGHEGKTVLVPIYSDSAPGLLKARTRADVLHDVMETVGDFITAGLDRQV